MKSFKRFFNHLLILTLLVPFSCTKPAERSLPTAEMQSSLYQNKAILSDAQIEQYADSVSENTDALEIARLTDEIFLDYWNKFKYLSLAEKEFIANKALTVQFDTVVKKLGLNEALFLRRLDTAAAHYRKLYQRFFAATQLDKLDRESYWKIFDKAVSKMNREATFFKVYSKMEGKELVSCINSSKVTDALKYQSLVNIYFGRCHEKMTNPNFSFDRWSFSYLGIQQAIGCNYSKLVNFEKCIGNDDLAF